MTNFETLHDLLVAQLQDLNDAEHQLIEAMPHMIAAASSTELRKALQEHHTQTREQVARLREAMLKLGITTERKVCKAMSGLIKESEEMIKATGDTHVRDAGLICAAQRIKHYEIAAYGCTKAIAAQEGHGGVANIIEESLKEEIAADRNLSRIAEGGFFRKSVNKEAANA